MTEDLGKKVLNTDMGYNDADAETIKEYLVDLLSTLWVKGESFSGKSPFGNSGWEYDLYEALAWAKLIDGDFDEEHQEFRSYDTKEGRRLITLAITALGED